MFEVHQQDSILSLGQVSYISFNCIFLNVVLLHEIYAYYVDFCSSAAEFGSESMDFAGIFFVSGFTTAVSEYEHTTLEFLFMV